MRARGTAVREERRGRGRGRGRRGRRHREARLHGGEGEDGEDEQVEAECHQVTAAASSSWSASSSSRSCVRERNSRLKLAAAKGLPVWVRESLCLGESLSAGVRGRVSLSAGARDSLSAGVRGRQWTGNNAQGEYLPPPLPLPLSLSSPSRQPLRHTHRQGVPCGLKRGPIACGQRDTRTDRHRQAAAQTRQIAGQTQT